MGRTEEEEIGSILNSFDEPFFLDHLARLLHGETWSMSCAYKGSVSSSLVSRSAVAEHTFEIEERSESRHFPSHLRLKLPQSVPQ